jgi:hypothetical protein
MEPHPKDFSMTPQSIDATESTRVTGFADQDDRRRPEGETVKSREHLDPPRVGRRRLVLGTSAVLALASLAVGSDASGQTFTVDFSSKLGPPIYRASGLIYGLSEDATQPPQHFVSDIKTQFLRVGGAQLGCPSGNWVNNTSNYTRRWNTVKAFCWAARVVAPWAGKSQASSRRGRASMGQHERSCR